MRRVGKRSLRFYAVLALGVVLLRVMQYVLQIAVGS